ncbi:unnamed protein product [Arctia plantaginis]|uniref:Uncharacterized protein n=1 Tax=Arctia plantaginis TaxID=874455 RepID=A0A8S0YW43_ARCPL|nr:unnamed protein product [Arctia plantaginis]
MTAVRARRCVAHAGQTASVCWAESSLQSQWWQAGLSSLLATECRYFPKQPCPESTCVSRKRVESPAGTTNEPSWLGEWLRATCARLRAEGEIRSPPGSQPLADKLRRALPPPNPTGEFRPTRKPPPSQRCGNRAWVRAAAHTGAPYSAIDRTTPVYSRLVATLGPPKLGKSRPRADAAPTSFGASCRRCSSKSHLSSRIRPRYFIWARTGTRTELTTIEAPGGGPRRGP